MNDKMVVGWMLMLVLLPQSLFKDMSLERLVRGMTDRMVDGGADGMCVY